MPCNDKNPCTTHSTCFKGMCIRGKFTKCAPPDQCKEKGVCNTFTGECLYLNKLNGAPCNDNNPFTLLDQCYNGKCTKHQLKFLK